MSGDEYSDGTKIDHFTPCPGCGTIGFTVQVWVGNTQMMQCGDNDCRVHEYKPLPANSDQ
jgi:hypothetical protein